MPWYEVAAIADLIKKPVTSVKAADKSICLIYNKGTIYATQRYCPHAGGNLSGGWCENGKLYCPLHRYSYDLDTGRGSAGQGDYINTYPVKTEDGKIFVQIDTLADKLKRLFTHGKHRN